MANRFMRAMGALLGRQEQSVDQLVAITRASWANEGRGGLSVQLSAAESRQAFHGWQYACSTLLAEAVMEIPWHIQARRGDEWENAPDHPLVALLQAVNPILTGEELWYYTMLDLLMVGKCYWYLPPNALNEPGEIYPLAGTVTPTQDKDGQVTAWKQKRVEFGKGVQERTYEPEEIVFLRFPQPGNILGGFGPQQAAGAQIKLDQQITEAQWSAMKNGLWPSALLKIPGRTADERKRILDEFNERYAGVKKGGGAMGTSENVQVEWPPNKPREMGFERGGDRMRDMILAMYRVPRAILGLSEGLPRANVEGMQSVFARWSVRPKVRLVEARVNQGLVQRHYGGDVRLKFDDPVMADREEERADATADLEHYVISVNERRADKGLEPVAWGDTPLAPLNIVPMGEGAATGQQGAASATDIAEAMLRMSEVDL